MTAETALKPAHPAAAPDAAMQPGVARTAGGLNIGAVFTPAKWAEFAIEIYGLLDAWLGGKTILDPTMGEGALLAALVEHAKKRGFPVESLPVSNLFGVEINGESHKKALDAFAARYNRDMTNNFFHGDIVHFGEKKFDMLFGNPPWCNFVDLPQDYKAAVKPLFLTYGLVDNTQKLLLGGSRIDIAALIIQKSIADNLTENGKAVFFLPLSLFLNDGAHAAFRRFISNGICYKLCSLYDFEGLAVFQAVTTRYGLALFKKLEKFEKKLEREREAPEPIPYFRFENNAWIEYKAASQKPGAPLLVTADIQSAGALPYISVPADAKPRQGINPCGAMNVFVFSRYESLDEDMCKVDGAYTLPKKFVFPLITSHNFKDRDTPVKWALLPYNTRTGKPLTQTEVDGEPALSIYLHAHKTALCNRKGTLIQTYIKRGAWWALLGVGRYTFSTYKIVWEAYGKASFKPQLFCGDWLANQALHAFIPCADQTAAERLLDTLSHPAVERYLLSSRMGGTMNWAQPGRIAAILHFKEG
jgi:hypothetical protein